MLVLSRADVESVFSTERALEAVRVAAAAYVEGRADVPVRTQLLTSDPAGEVLVMPGAILDPPSVGVKMWSRFPVPGDPATYRASAVLLVTHTQSGHEALMDASLLTDVRTGAMTGVASEYLAPSDARTLAVIGAGTQARTQVDAVAATTGVERVVVAGRSADRVAAFVAETQRRHPELQVEPAASAEAAVRRAEIVVAATTATRPVVFREWLERGVLVCGVGSHAPADAELDPAIVADADAVVVDTWVGSVAGAGDIGAPLRDGLIAEAEISELGELVLGRKPGRRSDDEIAVFKSVGFASLDLTAAGMVLDAALENGAGIDVPLD